jgi:hypothetical protein
MTEPPKISMCICPVITGGQRVPTLGCPVHSSDPPAPDPLLVRVEQFRREVEDKISVVLGSRRGSILHQLLHRRQCEDFLVQQYADLAAECERLRAELEEAEDCWTHGETECASLRARAEAAEATASNAFDEIRRLVAAHTALLAKLRELTKKWRHEAITLNSGPFEDALTHMAWDGQAIGRRDCADELAALLAHTETP